VSGLRPRTGRRAGLSNCGFNPLSIAAGAPAVPAAAPTAARSLRFAVLSAVFVLLIGAAGFYVARYQRALIRAVGSSIGLNHAISTDYTPEECEHRMTQYLAGMFTATANPGGAGELAQVQTRAGEEFGIGSREWRTLLDVYARNSGIAAIEGAHKALKNAAPVVSEFCLNKS
jgi:hypothetical protein